MSSHGHPGGAPQVGDDARVDVAGRGCPSPGPPSASGPSTCRPATRRRSPTPTRRCPGAARSGSVDSSGDAEELRGLLADVLVRGAVEAVAPDVPLRGDVAVDRVRRRRGGQVVEERGVEHGDVRQVGQHLAGHLDAQQRGRVVQRRERRQLVDLARSPRRRSIVGSYEVRPAVHHPVPDRDQARPCRRPPRRTTSAAVPQRGRRPLSSVATSRARRPRRSARRSRRPPTAPESGSTTAYFSDDEPGVQHEHGASSRPPAPGSP